MNNLAKIVAAAAITLTGPVVEKASAFTPSFAQVGYNYGSYYESVFYANLTENPDASGFLNATLPYGTNCGYYFYFYGLKYGTSEPYYDSGSLTTAYWEFVGAYYSYINYANPTYSGNLYTYYNNYAASQAQNAYDTGSYLYNYYGPIADYYYNLIWP